MDQETFVPMQAGLSFAAVAAAIAACGHTVGLPLLVMLTIASLIWVGFGVPYGMRSRGRRSEIRRREDRRALWSGTVGLAVPLALAASAWRLPDLEGLVFASQAADWAACATALAMIAILASSMVDWYLILPFMFGLLDGVPVWRHAEGLTPKRRRRFAKVWAAHRGLCEACVFSALALVLAIILVAAGNAVSEDPTLPTAIESLGGAGIAFGVLTFAGPRVGGAVTYMLAQSAGLGTWARYRDRDGRTFDGYVVDVSLHPGIKLRLADGEWCFVKLANCEFLHELEADRPPECDTGWRHAAVLERAEAERPPESAPQPAATSEDLDSPDETSAVR